MNVEEHFLGSFGLGDIVFPYIKSYGIFLEKGINTNIIFEWEKDWKIPVNINDSYNVETIQNITNSYMNKYYNFNANVTNIYGADPNVEPSVTRLRKINFNIINKRPVKKKHIVWWDYDRNVNTRATRKWKKVTDYKISAIIRFLELYNPDYTFSYISYRDDMDYIYKEMESAEFCIGYDGFALMLAKLFNVPALVFRNGSSDGSTDVFAKMFATTYFQCPWAFQEISPIMLLENTLDDIVYHGTYMMNKILAELREKRLNNVQK